MTGRAEVARLKQQLDATFERAENVNQDSELQADFAKYLCVLVSGYLERAVVALVREHVRHEGAPTLQRFVEIKTRNFANPKIGRVKELMCNFDQDWHQDLEGSLDSEQVDAVNSIVSQRNRIAHGESVEITYTRISKYYKQAQRVVDRIADLCVPLG